MHPTISFQNTPRSGERRRHARLRPSSIIYVELGSGNGGIILNLGVGGLAFQAVGKLNGQQELIVKFRLPSSRQTAEIVGGIAWLGPTHKDAGICFKGLTGNMQQDIADWITAQEQAYKAAALQARSRLKPMPEMPAMGKTSIPPPVSVGQVLPSRMPAKPDPSTGAGTSKSPLRTSPDSVSRTPLLDRNGRRWNSFFYWGRIDRLRKNSLYVSFRGAKRRGISLFAGLFQRAIPRGVYPGPAGARNHRARGRFPHPFYSGFAWSLGCFVILVVILTIASIARSPAGSSGSLQQTSPVPATSSVIGRSPAPVPPSQAPQAQQRTVRPRPHREWTAILKEVFLGPDNNTKTDIDQDQADVQVWISKDSGYYYCGGSPYYQTVQPGAFMTQGEALQSGYQPKLGNLCD
jgi:hypothetical protein